MKTLTVNVPVGGKVIITRPKKYTNTAQQDLFGGYRNRWIVDMANFIRSLPMPIAMSTARIEAGKRGMAAPLSGAWYGGAMRSAGLEIVGYQKSPIKSRRGGVEAVWSLSVPESHVKRT